MAFKPATQIESRPNFSSLLDEAPTEVKFAPPIPPGSYVAVVQPAWTKDVNQRSMLRRSRNSIQASQARQQLFSGWSR